MKLHQNVKKNKNQKKVEVEQKRKIESFTPRRQTEAQIRSVGYRADVSGIPNNSGDGTKQRTPPTPRAGLAKTAAAHTQKGGGGGRRRDSLPWPEAVAGDRGGGRRRRRSLVHRTSFFLSGLLGSVYLGNDVEILKF